MLFAAQPSTKPNADMNQSLTRLSHCYTAALRAHLKQGLNASLLPATQVGREAVRRGLETLELARIHEQTLILLELPKSKNGLVKRAENFFIEANAQIIATHNAAQQNKIHLRRLTTLLSQRAEQLATSNRQLQQGIVRRKLMADNFEKRGQQHRKCLAESLGLQKQLRQLTHQVIATHEDERKRISHELQDEIAQTLLGISVRLLALKLEARNNSKGLKQEITSTQRLVAKSVRRVGHTIGNV